VTFVLPFVIVLGDTSCSSSRLLDVLFVGLGVGRSFVYLIRKTGDTIA